MGFSWSTFLLTRLSETSKKENRGCLRNPGEAEEQIVRTIRERGGAGRLAKSVRCLPDQRSLAPGRCC